MSPERISVCIVCSQHVPDDVRVTHKIGKGLAAAGFAVTWVGPRRERTGNDYGIQFVYYKCGRGRLGRLWHGPRLWQTASRLPRHHVYLGVSPDSASVAVRLARKFKSKALFDIQEIYHWEMLERWVPRWAMPLASWLVREHLRSTCRHCDLVLGAGQTRLDPYADGAPATMVLRHCIPKDLVGGQPARVFPPGRKEMVIMHGKCSMGHGTGEVMHAIADLRKRYGIPCRVIMFGPRLDAPEYPQTPVGQLGEQLGITDCLDLRPMVPYEEMFTLMLDCDVGVIAYRRAFGVRCMPNRVFEYMAMGLPVIAPAYGVEMQLLLPKYNCGLLCDTEKPSDLADALYRLYQDPAGARQMGANGRAAFERELHWEAECKPLIDWIRKNAIS